MAAPWVGQRAAATVNTATNDGRWSSCALRTAERRTAVVDVAEGTADGALQHEAWRTTSGVAAGDG